MYEGNKVVTAQHFIPKGWKRVSLHQVAYIQTGLAKGKKDLVEPVEVPYLRVANVQDGHLDLSEIKTVQVSRKELERYLLKDGDVLMTEGGDFDKLGRGFVWEGQIENCLHQNHVFAVRADKRKLNPYFLSYQAGSGYGKGYFINCAKQSTNLASINSSQLKEYPVLLPGLKEQEKIVEIIRGWDRAIDLTERLIAAKQERRTWLVQQLLTGKRRLAGFDGEWREYRFGEFLTESRVTGSNGSTARKLTVKLYAKGVHPKEDRAGGGSPSTQYYVRSKGQFIYSKLDFLNGAFGIIPEDLDGYETTLDLPSFDGSARLNIRWLLYFVSREEFYSQQLGLANGGRKARRVNPRDFLSCKARMPERDEQDQIVSFLSLVDHELDYLRAQFDAVQEQKKGLMQQLLTGKRRLEAVK